MATFTVQMCSPTTRHAELIAPELAATERAQDFLDLAAEMWSYSHTAFFQRLQQRFGKRGAEEHVHVQFGDATGHRLRCRWAEDKFFSPDFFAVLARDHQQARRRIENRRHAFLPDGNCNRHARHKGKRHASRLAQCEAAKDCPKLRALNQ